MCSFDDAYTVSDAQDARLRRLAKRNGLEVRKGRHGLGTPDNHGGYRLLNPWINTIMAGERFNLTASEAAELISEMG